MEKNTPKKNAKKKHTTKSSSSEEKEDHKIGHKNHAENKVPRDSKEKDKNNKKHKKTDDEKEHNGGGHKNHAVNKNHKHKETETKDDESTEDEKGHKKGGHKNHAEGKNHKHKETETKDDDSTEDEKGHKKGGHKKHKHKETESKETEEGDESLDESITDEMEHKDEILKDPKSEEDESTEDEKDKHKSHKSKETEGGDKPAGKKKKVGPSDFERIRLLGRGHVGRVYLVKLKGSEELYAMKVLGKKEMVERNKVHRVMTEREILATADHPFIVTLYWSFQTKERLFFIMDYCAGGEFFRILQRQPHKCMTEDQVRFYAAEVLLALEYLHAKGFIYRDLKPENILLHATGHIRLTDFDLSKTAGPVEAHIVKSQFTHAPHVVKEPDLISHSFVGTEEYIAPEVLRNTGHSSSVDWWTFGILMYEMLYGTTPYRGVSREQTFKNIRKGNPKFPEHKRGPVSKECKNLIKSLLVVDAKKRLGTKGGAYDIKTHPFFKEIKWPLLYNEEPPIIPTLSSPDDTHYFPRLPDDFSVDKEENKEDKAYTETDKTWIGFKPVEKSPSFLKKKDK